MNNVSFREFVNDHWIVHRVYWITAEVIKGFVIGLFLELLNKRLFGYSSQYFRVYIVLSPIIEEVLFRGLCQSSIAYVQNVRNRNCAPTERDRKMQQAFRIFLSASLFGFMHLRVYHKNWKSAAMQVTLCFLSGVVYGYLRERYRTLAIAILAHGLNNTIVLGGKRKFPQHPRLVLLAVYVLKLSFLILAVPQIGQVFLFGARRLATFSNNLSFEFFRPLERRESSRD